MTINLMHAAYFFCYDLRIDFIQCTKIEFFQNLCSK